MARTIIDVGSEHDFQRDFIRGAARLIYADLTKPFPTVLSDMVYMTTASNTNEIQTVTITGTPTGGTFTLTFKGYTTTAIAYNAAAAAVDAALEALGTIGTGGVTVGGGPGPGTPYTVTFTSQLGNQNVPSLTAVGSFTGGTTPAIAVTTTTPGIGIYDAKTGWTDLGPTLGGITVARNNAEETFSVDQIQADILTLPTNWEQSVSASVSRNDIDTIQYLWEGGTIVLDGVTGERTLPMGTPTIFRKRRVGVLFQRQSLDAGVTAGGVRAYCWRITHRSAQESSIVHNKEGAQATIPFTWKILADSSVQDEASRFGSIIDQF
jgi:hypothetical protein